MLGGGEPTKTPMLAPLKRVQSVDLDREREPGQCGDPAQATSRRTIGVNSLFAAISAIWASNRSRRALVAITVS